MQFDADISKILVASPVGASIGGLLLAIGIYVGASPLAIAVKSVLVRREVFRSGRAQEFVSHSFGTSRDAATLFSEGMVLATLAFAVAAFASGSLMIAIIGVGVALAAPDLLLARARKTFDRDLERTLPGALQQVANELTVTPSLDRALEAVSRTAESPAREELALLRNSIATLGVEAALERASDRLRSKSFSLTAAVIRVGTGRGGRMVDAIKSLGATLIELERLNRKIEAAGSGGRRAILLLTIAGPAITFATWAFLPGQDQALFDPTAQRLLMVAFGVYVAAIMLARRILKVSV